MAEDDGPMVLPRGGCRQAELQRSALCARYVGVIYCSSLSFSPLWPLFSRLVRLKASIDACLSLNRNFAERVIFFCFLPDERRSYWAVVALHARKLAYIGGYVQICAGGIKREARALNIS